MIGLNDRHVFRIMESPNNNLLYEKCVHALYGMTILNAYDYLRELRAKKPDCTFVLFVQVDA